MQKIVSLPTLRAKLAKTKEKGKKKIKPLFFPFPQMPSKSFLIN